MNTTTLFRILIVLMSACLCTCLSLRPAEEGRCESNRSGRSTRSVRGLGCVQGIARRQENLLRAFKANIGCDGTAGRNRDAAYAFVSTRPSEKVKNEVSVIVGYPQKAGHDATAAIGSATYAMYTQNDGAWLKNAAEEAQMVDAMRKGADLVVKSESGRGTKTTDTYSLKGIAQALDKVAEECK
jgi:hypothetical protein